MRVVLFVSRERVVVAIAALLGLATLGLGFFADDYAHHAALDHRFRGAPPFWDLFRFANGNPDDTRLLIEQGIVPWWTVDELKIRFIRPISSCLFSLDYWLFGKRAWPAHLISLAWWIALVLVVGRLLRGLLSDRVARLAQLVFVLSPAHVITYAWLSARNGLMAATLALLGWLLHRRYRRQGWAPGRFLGPVFVVMGFLSSEGALGVLAFWFADELVSAIAERRNGARTLPVVHLATPVVMAVVLVGGYKLLGGGAHGSGGYLDPLEPQITFVPSVHRGLALLAQATLSFPSEAAAVSPHAPFDIAGLVGMGLVATALVRLTKDPEAASDAKAALWLLGAALFAVAPGVGGFPGGRVLLLPNIGFASAIALIALHAWRIARTRGFLPRAAWRLAGAAMVGVHLLVAPILAAFNVAVEIKIARQLEEVARTAPVGGADHVFVVASDPMVAVYPWAWRLAETDTSLCWSWIAGAKTTHRIERESKTSWTVETVNGTWLEGAFEQLYRSPGLPLERGYEAHQCGATVQVLETHRGRPTRVRVRLDPQPVGKDPDSRWIVWNGHSLERVRELAPGESVTLFNVPGPMGFF